MFKKISLPPESIPLYFLCMVLEFCLLYFYMFNPFNIFDLFGVKYSLQVDALRVAVAHFAISALLNILARKLVKSQYGSFRLLVLASLLTYMILSTPLLYIDWGPFYRYTVLPLSCLFSYAILICTEKAIFDKRDL